MKRWMVNNAGTVVTNERFVLPNFLDMIKQSPWRAVTEIGAGAAILAIIFAMLYLKSIINWLGGL